MSDFQDVLIAAREGEGWALGRLFRVTYPRFVCYVGAVAPADAEDVAADAWLDVARGLHRFEGDEQAFRAWAFTIARRRLLDLRRSRARRRATERSRGSCRRPAHPPVVSTFRAKSSMWLPPVG